MDTEPEVKEVTKRLRFFFEASGMRRDVWAKQSGVTVSTVSYWLTGGAEPTYDNLAKAVAALGIDLPTFWAPLPEGTAVVEDNSKAAG